MGSGSCDARKRDLVLLFVVQNCCFSVLRPNEAQNYCCVHTFIALLVEYLAALVDKD
jgi:uncharacterized membrane protein